MLDSCLPLQAALRQLESLVHPLVYSQRRHWLQQRVSEGRHSILVLDIPLLYETGAEGMVWRNFIPHRSSDEPGHPVMSAPIPGVPCTCPSSTALFTYDWLKHTIVSRPPADLSLCDTDYTFEEGAIPSNNKQNVPSLR